MWTSVQIKNLGSNPHSGPLHVILPGASDNKDSPRPFNCSVVKVTGRKQTRAAAHKLQIWDDFRFVLRLVRKWAISQ